MANIRKSSFKCRRCGEELKSAWSLQVHKATMHTGGHRCPDCGRQFVNSNHLKEHMMTHTGEKPHECSKCGKQFAQKGSLNGHMMTHTGERPHKCSDCDLAFRTSSELVTHLIKHTTNKRYMCSDCGKCFKWRGGFTSHMRYHTGEKKYKCTECEKKFVTSEGLKSHMKTHTGEKAYMCSLCGKLFAHGCSLKSHMMSHTGQKPHKCLQCDKRFSHKSHLKRHMMTHTDQNRDKERRYECPKCSKLFVYFSSIKRHMMIHTGEKPFKCSQCDKQFREKACLKKHMITHTEAKPYGCSDCGKQYKLEAQLKKHIGTHRGDKLYMCSVCDRRFYTMQAVNVHIQTHAGDAQQDIPVSDNSTAVRDTSTAVTTSPALTVAHVNAQQNVPVSDNSTAVRDNSIAVRDNSTAARDTSTALSTDPTLTVARVNNIGLGHQDEHVSFTLLSVRGSGINASNVCMNLQSVEDGNSQIDSSRGPSPEMEDKKGLYICEKCKFLFHSKSAFQTHLQTHDHTEQNPRIFQALLGADTDVGMSSISQNMKVPSSISTKGRPSDEREVRALGTGASCVKSTESESTNSTGLLGSSVQLCTFSPNSNNDGPISSSDVPPYVMPINSNSADSDAQHFLTSSESNNSEPISHPDVQNCVTSADGNDSSHVPGFDDQHCVMATENTRSENEPIENVDINTISGPCVGHFTMSSDSDNPEALLASNIQDCVMFETLLDSNIQHCVMPPESSKSDSILEPNDHYATSTDCNSSGSVVEHSVQSTNNNAETLSYSVVEHSSIPTKRNNTEAMSGSNSFTDTNFSAVKPCLSVCDTPAVTTLTSTFTHVNNLGSFLLDATPTDDLNISLNLQSVPDDNYKPDSGSEEVCGSSPKTNKISYICEKCAFVSHSDSVFQTHLQTHGHTGQNIFQTVLGVESTQNTLENIIQCQTQTPDKQPVEKPEEEDAKSLKNKIGAKGTENAVATPSPSVPNSRFSTEDHTYALNSAVQGTADGKNAQPENALSTKPANSCALSKCSLCHPEHQTQVQQTPVTHSNFVVGMCPQCKKGRLSPHSVLNTRTGLIETHYTCILYNYSEHFTKAGFVKKQLMSNPAYQEEAPSINPQRDTTLINCSVCCKLYSQLKQNTMAQRYNSAGWKCPNCETKPNAQEKSHKCSQCDKEFKHECSLGRHMRTHKLKTVVPHECLQCVRRFRSRSELKAHTMNHTGDKPLKCSLCNKGFIRPVNLKLHMMTHTGEKPHKCSECGQGFRLASDVKVHMIKHTGIKRYMCSDCGKQFKWKSSFRVHLMSHREEKLYKCTECEKRFVMSESLKSHMRTHTGDKPYMCSLCGKQFRHGSTYTSHMMSHTGEKPYKCSDCNKRFTQPGSLQTHIMTHTGEKRHACSVCGHKFTQSGSLKAHMRTHTGEKPYKCSDCGKRFRRTNSLKTHMMTHHDKNAVIVQDSEINSLLSQ